MEKKGTIAESLGVARKMKVLWGDKNKTFKGERVLIAVVGFTKGDLREREKKKKKKKKK